MMDLSDLDNLIREQGFDANAGAIFRLFEFYVCQHCGHTSIYAGAAVKAVAADKGVDPDDGLVGIS